MVSPFTNRAGRSGVTGSASDGLSSLNASRLLGRKEKADSAKLDLRKDLRFIGVIFKNNKTLWFWRLMDYICKNDKEIGCKH
jgi:hypothetical protein